ncbi:MULTISPECIES: NAD-dependent epimerase/dehydratase family protein [unclassified Cryobacterium]|uniref:NAD-dependent epimerase/dehydratase family protein n=1 Tax=unclassified Cryobacterium TaxID=2649013 RepID=UPI002AB35D07|nr:MULTISPECIES: NAD-dependent epimerase/dehydratase family protein [unclassified Cryobacterium]MDY7541022.1 NAD-dependent epimerase/dehydratase family protein [Cryobacterium sp. 5B3]MEA9998442.1 NAD-dependent epimerase/dehydratase family protein [Cryobacterium sp. RTS3]MEB0265555.1 NAD-dependent epimerase/dehydratase family protein [Cryobacterium sp. 10I5]MEB0273903.1 NAD-dependent epimerase/dehydratase family protein [Cryobacterium sp. 5B3]
MTHHLVVGAGLIGRPVAERLAARGDTVTIATRSGSAAAGATPLVLDASDPDAFSAAAAGASTIFLCTNPPYTDWAERWPPIIGAAISAAAASDAALVVMGNLYPYGRPRGAMTEHTPETTTERKGLIRKEGWRRVRAAHEAGQIRAVEVRASDYFGPGATGTAHLGEDFFGSILASKTARVVGDPALPHSWSYLPDIVSTLIAAADYAGDWGRIWHVPSASASRVEIAAELNERYDCTGSVAGYPQWVLRGIGLVNPLMREIYASSYQFTSPFMIDSAETERELGVVATPWLDALTVTADSYRA